MLHDEHGSGSDSASGSGTPSRTGSFSQSSRNPSTRGPPSSSAPSSFVRRSSTTSLARHSDATAATAGGNKPSKGSWLSRRGSQSDQFYDVEPLADSGACMRFLNRFGYVFCYMLAQAGNWARSGEILPILNTLASVAFLILLPYQAAFDSTVNFNALYAVGYGLDLIIITYRFLKASEVWPLRTWARELLHGPDGSHKVRKKRSSKRRHRVGDRVGPMGGHTTGSDSDQGSPQHMRRTAMKKGQMNGQTVNGHDVSPGSSGHDGSKEGSGHDGGVWQQRANEGTVVPGEVVRRPSVPNDEEKMARAKMAMANNRRASTFSEGAVRNVIGSSGSSSAKSHAHRSRRKARQEKVSRVTTALMLLLSFPFDAFFWGSSLQYIIPYLRLLRLLVAPVQAHNFIAQLEKSQAMPFAWSRVFRIVTFWLIMSHWLCCCFYVCAYRVGPNNDHYASAPWRAPAEGESLNLLYLRSFYWALMTLTTTGHVDLLGYQSSRDWEVGVALAVTFFATFIYIYLNANFTSIFLRMNTRMEQYRTRLAGVDNYLRRNKVSRDLRRVVKKHFEHTYNQDSESVVLEQMPHSLRREVLKNIYLRSMRRVPLFFGCDSALITQIAEMLRRVVCLPGQVIVSQGDVVKEFYVLESGHVRAVAATYKDDEDDNNDDDSVAGDEILGAMGRVSRRNSKEGMGGSGDEDNNSMHNGSNAGSIGDRSVDQLIAEHISTSEHGSSKDSSKHDGRHYTLDERLMQSTDSRHQLNEETPTLVRRGSTSFMLNGAQAGAAGNRPKVRIAGPASVPSIISSVHSNGSMSEEVITDMDAAGATFGDVGVIFGTRQEATIEAIVPSQCLVLQKVDFDNLLKDFPDSLDVMKKNVKTRLRQLNEDDPLLEKLDQMQVDRKHKHISKLCDMLFAAQSGEVDIVREAIERGGVDVNELDYEKRSCLHIAAAAGQLAVVELLLQHKSAVNRKDQSGKTPLMNAVAQDHGAVVKALLKAKAKLDWDESMMANELCDRAHQGKLMAIQMLLDCGVNVNSADYDRRTALHLAASEGNKRMCQYLVDHGANINCADRWKGTPLSDAMREGHTAVAQFLMSRGGRLNWDEMKTSGELCELARKGDISQLSLILRSGCDVNSADYDSRTALHLAASEGNLSTVQSLLARNDISVDCRDRWGNTPLFDAVRNGHSVVAKELKLKGATLGLDETQTAGELCEMSKAGSRDKLELFIESGADVNAKDYDARTALHLASSVGNLPIVKALLERGAEVNAKDRWFGTPLRDAVREGRMEVAKALRESGGELGYNETEASGELCELAKEGSLEKLSILLECGCPADAKDYDSRTALHLASSVGNLPIVKALLDLGAQVNAKDRWGGTPLRDAVREGRMEVARQLRASGGDLGYDEVQASGELCELAKEGSLEKLGILLECGCPADAKDYDSRTALHLASSVGNAPIVKALLERGAHVNAKDRWGGTPLRDAVREGRMEVANTLHEAGGELGYTEVEASGELCELSKEGSLEKLSILLKCGCDPNSADYDKRTALHLASSVGSLQIVKALLERGAEVNSVDRWGGTPLRDAVREGHATVATALSASGGELKFTEDEASGKLCELAKQGSRDLLKILLKCGIAINAKDYDARTALHLAASEGNVHVVQLLLDNGANAFSVDRWGNHPLSDAAREGHQQVASILSSAMDGRLKSGDVGEFVHMEEVRRFLLNDAGLKDGKGLHSVMATLDTEGVDSVDLITTCWDRIEPMLKAGPAARLAKALGVTLSKPLAQQDPAAMLSASYGDMISFTPPQFSRNASRRPSGMGYGGQQGEACNNAVAAAAQLAERWRRGGGMR